MPLVSVIIPVYKVEKYLNQCVDSVIDQKLDDIEIILVDDGSPDGCPQICDEYAEKHSFIKVIHKPNGGLSSARNAGIQAAAGQYIIFMDSDDWWNGEVSVHQMLTEVLQKPEVDMFLFTSLDYIEGDGLYQRTEHTKLQAIRTDSVEHYYEDLLANGNLEVSAATKILKTDFVKANTLYFQEGIVSEDCEWMLRLLRVAQNISILNTPLYICRIGRKDSITNTIGKKNISDMLDIIQSSIEYYSDLSEDKNRMRYEYCYCAYLWFCALGLSVKISKQDYRELTEKFKSTGAVCLYSNSKKTKAAYRAYKLFGLNGARNILGLYIKLKNQTNFNKKKQESV